MQIPIMHRTRVTGQYFPHHPSSHMSCVYISPSGRHVRLRQYGNKRLIVRVTNMRGGFPFLRIPGIYLRGMPNRQSSLYDTINRKDLQADGCY